MSEYKTKDLADVVRHKATPEEMFLEAAKVLAERADKVRSELDDDIREESLGDWPEIPPVRNA